MATGKVNTAIGKADVDFSLRGEQSNEEEQRHHEEIAIAHNGVGTKQEVQFVIFKLTKTKGTGRVNLPATDDVINPETGVVERIRCLSGVASIWMKDQEKLTPEYVRANSRTFIFENKILRVPIWDKQALEFLRTTRHCIDNPNHKTGSWFEFYEYNPEKQQEQQYEKEMKQLNMIAKASTVPVAEMEKHFIHLGGQLNNELGSKKSEKAIRGEYMRFAKNNPIEFEKSLDSKEVNVGYLVKKAIIDNLIDIGTQPGSAYWGAGGFITKIPSGLRPVDALIDLALTNSKEGNDFLEILEKKVKT